MILSLVWWALFWCWLLSEIFIALAMRTRHSGGDVHDRGTQKILWIVLLVAITAANVIRGTSASMFGRAHWLVPFSILLLAIALCIRWTAILSLGKSFSANVAIRDTQTIYKGGLYRWVRHPSYLGLLLVFLAVALHSQNWISFFIALIPTTLAVLYRIRVEENVLTHAFGDEYATYSRTTWRLLPWFY
ncbi:MAG: isoprenylcysteine carboxylmethyltransferase family protein [Acidobacteriaceae bacterium]